MKLNPNALAFWIFTAGIGFLAGDLRGAVIGLLVGVAASLLSAVLN